ncbi:MAG: hypothetical protein DIU56_017075 [Pseudomonadota bacterium]|jgi:hypothetical protein|nr:hypothetical protein [Gammaproteobacteria bacterium]
MSRTSYVLIASAGVFNLAFAAFHLFFWRLFRWPEQLPRLSAVNAGIMQVLNLCLTYLLAIAGAVCLIFPLSMGTSELGRFLLLALTGFWIARAIYQPMFFRLAHPVSTVLFLLFIAGAALHGIAWAIAGN